jgi:hypothetical protein
VPPPKGSSCPHAPVAPQLRQLAPWIIDHRPEAAERHWDGARLEEESKRQKKEGRKEGRKEARKEKGFSRSCRIGKKGQAESREGAEEEKEKKKMMEMEIGDWRWRLEMEMVSCQELPNRDRYRYTE